MGLHYPVNGRSGEWRQPLFIFDPQQHDSCTMTTKPKRLKRNESILGSDFIFQSFWRLPSGNRTRQWIIFKPNYAGIHQ